MQTQYTANGRGDLAEIKRNALPDGRDRETFNLDLDAYSDRFKLKRLSDTAKAEAFDRALRQVLPDVSDSSEGLQVVSWADMQALPPLTFLVDDLLPVGGVSLMVGHPKAGKSTLARVLAAEVARYGDGSFLGRDIMNAGPVLYYSPDEAPQMTVQHFRGILPKDADGIDFVQSGDLDGLGDLVDKRGSRLLIVDTLGRLFQAERFPDGDSYMAWQTHLDQVRRIASDTGCHICLLHHARKSGGDRSLSVLGSAAIAGSADTVVSITVTEDDADGWVRHVESVNRAGVELPRQRLALQGDGWLTVEPPAPNPKADAVAEARAMRRDGMSIRAIADQMGVSVGTAHKWTK